MATRQKITFENSDKEPEIHFVDFGQKDMALCGHDLAGDDCYGYTYEEATDTKEKVNCKDCIAIVEYCKKIKASEYKSKPHHQQVK